jgi:hypothetical protein
MWKVEGARGGARRGKIPVRLSRTLALLAQRCKAFGGRDLGIRKRGTSLRWPTCRQTGASNASTTTKKSLGKRKWQTRTTGLTTARLAMISITIQLGMAIQISQTTTGCLLGPLQEQPWEV